MKTNEMELRDYFAGQALVAVFIARREPYMLDNLSRQDLKQIYKYADQMLAYRKWRNEKKEDWMS